MQVNQITNPLFNSNTYLLAEDYTDWVWLIDIGDFSSVMKTLKANSVIKGVFITHAHIDHIYGLNNLVEVFPECIVYASIYAKQGLYSEKVNLSFYHECPFIYSGTNIYILKENDIVNLYEKTNLEVYETPGHNPGCLSFAVGNYLFTGDSLIPGVKVVTKLKGGNKQDHIRSTIKLHELIKSETVICPGHGKSGKAIDLPVVL